MIGALIVNAFQGSLTRIPVKDMALRIAHFSESPRICRCAKGEPKGFELGDRPGWSNHQRVIRRARDGVSVRAEVDTNASHEARDGVSVSREVDIRAHGSGCGRSETHRHGLGRPRAAKGERAPGHDAEGGGGRHTPRDRPAASVLYGEDLIREAPDVHIPEIDGGGRGHGEIDLGDATRGERAGACIAAQVHGAHRDVIGGPGDQPREPEAYGCVRPGAGCRRCNRERAGSGTGTGRRAVINTIGRQIGQGASIRIRGGGNPGGIQDPRFCWAHKENGCEQPHTKSKKLLLPLGSDWHYAPELERATGVPREKALYFHSLTQSSCGQSGTRRHYWQVRGPSRLVTFGKRA